MDARVVVTGLGLVTPVGTGKNNFWKSLVSGKSGIGKVTSFDVSDYSCQIAGEVNGFDPADFFDRREAKKMDRFAQFAVAAACMAWDDAALAQSEVDRDQVGVLVASGIGGIKTIEEQYRILLEKGPRRVSPFFVPMLIANMASGYISILLGLRGPNSTVVTACAASSHALGESYRMIQRGDARVMVTGGAEAAVSPIAFAGFCSARALSTRNDAPKKASRPFDAQRDGFVIGEGSGVVILERLDQALERGAHIYGEIVGYGLSGDGYHVTAPDPEGRGAILSMQRALRSAGVGPEAVDYINSHGTSTVYNDKIETAAIKNIFGAHARKLLVNSTKSMTGHLLGAAGAVEVAAILLQMQSGLVHPTINYDYPDPECDLDYVPNMARPHQVNLALSNSFGFGGTNASLLIKRYSRQSVERQY